MCYVGQNKKHKKERCWSFWSWDCPSLLFWCLTQQEKNTWSSGVSSTQWLLSRHAATWLSNRCIKLGASPSTPNLEKVWVSLIFETSANRSVVAKFIFFGCTMFVHISRECWAPCSITQSTHHTTAHSTSTFDAEQINFIESQQFTPTSETRRPTDTTECGNSDKNLLWRPPCDDDKIHQIMPPQPNLELDGPRTLIIWGLRFFRNANDPI